MKRQQFLDGPAMIRNASSHRRCGPATNVGQTRMRCTKIIDRTDQVHAMLQRLGAARQCAPSAGQRSQPLTNVALSRSMYAVLITPSPCDRRLNVSTRAGVPSTMRRSVSTTRRCS